MIALCAYVHVHVGSVYVCGGGEEECVNVRRVSVSVRGEECMCESVCVRCPRGVARHHVVCM